ncbi:S8 family serine peptidase [Flavivirga sp. 57AJ16]|uniref:S8 family serine peptidase n=1 Tax=Flavivirga sp. 57AJ16 TaxID=3025307 RepID=UPI002365572F|nr:S8 family serine peptidase [Flavivirga sp. 57AJ16]MDD7886921.1 S8 family serine peptidase [Flavivirga sp. 57AJ16]
MKKIIFPLLCILFSSITFSQKSNNLATNELIIKFKPNPKHHFKNVLSEQKFNHKSLDFLNEKLKVETIKLTGNKKKADTYILTFTAQQDLDSLIKIYQNIEQIEYVEPNFIGHAGGKRGVLPTIPNDNYFSRQYGLYNDGTFNASAVNDADIDMELGWDIEQGDSNIIVAVLDGGAKLDHPEFNGRIWTNQKEVLNGIDDDNNGYIDDINGWDFANNDNNAIDDDGHGTNVAGIIGANANNNIGYVGVDWNCKLMICKILDENSSGYYSWWVDAIYYAVDNGAKVINMSVGGAGFSTSMQMAVNYANANGVTIVACMMNTNNNVTYYPAGYEKTIAVGSTDPNDQRSSPFFWNDNSGSNYGGHIDVVAPGNFIYGLNYVNDTNYNSYWGGTSQATPLVTGLSSLLLAKNPNLSPDDIRNIIRNTAEDQVGKVSEDILGFDNYYGYGRINAYQALNSSLLGVDDFEDVSKSISISPNPIRAGNLLKISNVLDGENTISIYNMLGQKLLSEQIITKNSKHTTQLPELKSGTYLLKIKNVAKNRLTIKKMVVQ